MNMNMDMNIPFVNFTNFAQDEKLDNRNPLPKRKIFHYHTITQTFLGTIDWTKVRIYYLSV